MTQGQVEGVAGALPTATPHGWPLPRYLWAVALATLAAAGVLAWARPSLLTGIVGAAGLGHRVDAAQPRSFYAVRVAPILDAQCAGCHGARLQRARLRLDTLGDLRLGGKNGAVVVAGDPQASELYRRLRLPKTDPRAMPGGSKPPLSADEIKVLRLWIAAGADGRVPVTAVRGAPPPPPAPIVFKDIDPAAVAKARAPRAATVQALMARYPGVITYQARDTAALAINARRAGAAFDDADLARLKPVAAHVTRLDLSGTAISDAAGVSLAAFVNVGSLRLADTRTGDALLQATAAMPHLRSLAVIGTNATPGRVAQLRQRGLKVYDGR